MLKRQSPLLLSTLNMAKRGVSPCANWNIQSGTVPPKNLVGMCRWNRLEHRLQACHGRPKPQKKPIRICGGFSYSPPPGVRGAPKCRLRDTVHTHSKAARVCVVTASQSMLVPPTSDTIANARQLALAKRRRLIGSLYRPQMILLLCVCHVECLNLGARRSAQHCCPVVLYRPEDSDYWRPNGLHCMNRITGS